MNESASKRRALGRGLESLLPASAPAPAAATPGAGAALIPIDQLFPNPGQPRKTMNDAALEELAASIRAQGVLQPILARRVREGYEIVAGERRFHAALLAGLEVVPVIIREFNDQQALEAAIVENLQREDLNPIDQARGFAELSQKFHFTQEQIAEKTGKDRASVANYMRLLKLDAEVRRMLEAGELTMGHARALIGLGLEAQTALAHEAQEKGWSVRQLEERVQAITQPRPAPDPKPRDPNVRDAEEQLARALGAKVQIRTGARHSGQIQIGFSGLDDFQRLFDRLLQ